MHEPTQPLTDPHFTDRVVANRRLESVVFRRPGLRWCLGLRYAGSELASLHAVGPGGQVFWRAHAQSLRGRLEGLRVAFTGTSKTVDVALSYHQGQLRHVYETWRSEHGERIKTLELCYSCSHLEQTVERIDGALVALRFYRYSEHGRLEHIIDESDIGMRLVTIGYHDSRPHLIEIERGRGGKFQIDHVTLENTAEGIQSAVMRGDTHNGVVLFGRDSDGWVNEVSAHVNSTVLTNELVYRNGTGGGLVPIIPWVHGELFTARGIPNATPPSLTPALLSRLAPYPRMVVP